MFLQAVMLVCLAAEETAAAPPMSDPHCGSRCLYVALRGLGFDVADLDEVKSRLGELPVDGYTLGQLEAAARAYGAETLAVETTPDALAMRKRPFACIAHLSHDHFVLITGIDAQSATLIDPPHSTDVPLDTLRVIWDRKALLISPKPLVREEDLPVANSRWPWAVAAATLVVAFLLFAWGWRRTPAPAARGHTP